MAIPKRCVESKVCVLKFSIFSCAHLGSSAHDLSKRPKWSTYVESKVIGVKSLCLEGLVDYSSSRRCPPSLCPYSPFLLRTVLGALRVRHGVVASTQRLSASCYQKV